MKHLSSMLMVAPIRGIWNMDKNLDLVFLSLNSKLMKENTKIIRKKEREFIKTHDRKYRENFLMTKPMVKQLKQATITDIKANSKTD